MHKHIAHTKMYTQKTYAHAGHTHTHMNSHATHKYTYVHTKHIVKCKVSKYEMQPFIYDVV